VQAIILAAGYATRLRPITERVAKPLLPLAGRPIVEYIYDNLSAVPGLAAVHVVTNDRFAADFERWAAATSRPLPIQVHNDGTRSNDDRLGAIGDIRFTVERAGLQGEDLLIIAGDNLFDFSLAAYVAFWRDKSAGGAASCIAVREEPDPALVSQYSAAHLDEDDRVTAFVEKPERPTTSLIGIATYIYHRAHVPLIRDYLGAGNSPDQPGRYIAWLHARVPVYGYRFSGDWLDIGNPEQLLHADNEMRSRAGLPQRAAYSLD
jgi:glucose-1-phosphate thymidylyltransferase